jgi:hypothetical protein
MGEADSEAWIVPEGAQQGTCSIEMQDNAASENACGASSNCLECG